jgi:spermidine synthase
VINQDGRVFLNDNHEQYDLVYLDAFNGDTPPFQLASVEAAGLVRQALAPDGVVVANVIGQAEGDGFFQAEYATYSKLFARVVVGGAQVSVASNVRQNLIMLASKNADRLGELTRNWKVDTVSPPVTGEALSDDYAPVERLSDRRE